MSRPVAATLLGLVVLALLGGHAAFAQAHNPFGVGISEGGGYANGFTGWIIREQIVFERQLSAAIRTAKADGSALWWLAGLSFVYGVFHAAGPGHGKVVMTSYLFANERALRRGLVLTLLAALLQGLVAIALVGVLAIVFRVTASQMKYAATLVEIVSFAGVAVLGAWLSLQKGRRLIEALRMPRRRVAAASGPGRPAFAFAAAGIGGTDDARACACTPGLRFQGLAGSATLEAHGPGCRHAHAPDPAGLGAERFAWTEAGMTVLAAGLRPCSGAILVLVFALAQAMFVAGIVSVFAMSLGTAITTGAIATLAVLARGVALRLSRPGTWGGTVALRGLETGAALLILLAGLLLAFGDASLGGA